VGVKSLNLKQAYLVLAFSSLIGCGGDQVKPQPVDLKGAASTGEQDKIREALQKAGITKEIGTIVDGGDDWLVTLKLDGLGPNGEPPPGRPIPDKALVNKKSFDVTKLSNPGNTERGSRTFDPNNPRKR